METNVKQNNLCSQIVHDPRGSLWGEANLLVDGKVKIYTLHEDGKSILLKFVIENLSSKLYSNSNSTSINLLYSLESRLASYLLSMSDSQNNAPNYLEVNIPKLTEISKQ